MPQYLSTDPNAGAAAPPRVDEGRFRAWYQQRARRLDLDPDPDAPEHFYDYRAAFAAGAEPDVSGHWPSQFKREGHPRLIIDGVDTRTGQPARPRYLSTDPGAGRPGSELRQSKPQSAFASAWDSVREAIFGHPDRAEARAAGVGLQPTPAEMAQAILFEAGPMIGPPGAATVGRGLGAVGSRVPGVVGRGITAAGEFAAEHPRLVSAAGGAVSGGMYGDENAALAGAIAGAVLGGRAGAPRTSAPEAPVPVPVRTSAPAPSRGLPPGYVPVRKVTAKPAPPAAEMPAPTAPAKPAPKASQAELDAFARDISAPPPPGNRAAKATAAKEPPKAAPKAETKPDPGKARVAAHGELMAFAKQIAQENPKVGKKIWILMKDGKPVRMLTSDQAGAVSRAKRAGETATWVRNLWGRASDAFESVD